MKALVCTLFVVMIATAVFAEGTKKYQGDEKCPPPADLSAYSPPYDAREHPNEYPTFPGADQPGWSCSYMRPDGVYVQFGDSRTPQQQWSALYGGGEQDN